MANTPGSGDESTRRRLAFTVVVVSIAGVILISGVALALAGDNRPDMAQLVFSSVLPLLGTWVGTVLAFYFARENLKAATESTLALSGRTDTGTPVTEVMIDASTWTAYDLGPADPPEAAKLAD